MNAKEALQVLIDNLEYPCDKEYDIVWNALNRLEYLELERRSFIVVGGRMSGKQNIIAEKFQRLEELEKFLKIIKEDFYLNGFDEFIPKSFWYYDEKKQDFVKEMLK